MNQLNLEITFIEDSKQGQIWFLKNLSMKDILEFYDYCILAFIRDTNIFVLSGDKREELYEFINTLIRQSDTTINEIDLPYRH